MSPGPDAVPVLIVTGPVGAGKTTVGQAIADHLDAIGCPHAFVDMDALRACFPRPADDPFHVQLGLRNLAVIWRNFQDAGAERLIIADVVESRDLRGYQAAVPGAEIAVVRIEALPGTIEQRLRRRETGEGLAWHLARAIELAEMMARHGIGDLVIGTDGRTPAEVAEEIVRRLG
jgi:hypothetical protein